MSLNVADALFNQADINQDGSISRNEFQALAGNSPAAVADTDWYNATAYGASVGYGSGLTSSETIGYGGVSSYDASLGYGVGGGLVLGGGLVGGAGLVGAGYGSSSAVLNTQYATDAQGLFQDPNPTIIRRPNQSGVQTYTQNIRVRFLQPPPVPPHGPLIIREVRPPQPPVPAPLRIRQQAPPLPTPPPLVLRERPPARPATIASQTVIRRLPGLPVPPRSVIIERLPALPPRPRDIVIERWVPYGLQAKRRTLVQRAPLPAPYPHPRNVIVQYEPVQVRILRQFQRLGVTPASPYAYVQQYGPSLQDSISLVQQARAAGVVEDISPPPPAVAYGYSSAVDSSILGGGLVSGGLVGGGLVGGAGLVGAGWDTSLSAVEGSSWGTGLVGGGLVGGSWNAGVDLADAAFRNADLNQDGRIDRAEFANFVEGGVV